MKDYITTFAPMVLRWQVLSGTKILPPQARRFNFGNSKGLGFDRVLILPAESQMDFVLNAKPFTADAETAQNKLYVAITRARYSVGFIVPDKIAAGLRFPVWTKQTQGR